MYLHGIGGNYFIIDEFCKCKHRALYVCICLCVFPFKDLCSYLPRFIYFLIGYMIGSVITCPMMTV